MKTIIMKFQTYNEVGDKVHTISVVTEYCLVFQLDFLFIIYDDKYEII